MFATTATPKPVADLPPGEGKPPRVSVVIPCRNERAHIEGCVRDLFAQEPVPGGIEVLVADGRSDDGTREHLLQLAAEFPGLRMIDNPGRIVPTGLNSAIRAAKGEIVIRVDAHTRYARDYLKQCVDELARTAADNVGGPWVAKGHGYVSRAVAAAFQSPLVMGGARGHDTAYEGYADTVYLGCWRWEAFSRFGLFDEELVRNQDDELNLRITRNGGRVWQSAKIRSEYSPRNSIRAVFRQYSQYGYWKVRVIQKHRLPASPRHLVPGAFVACMLLLAPLACLSGWARLALLIVTSAYLAANFLASAHSAARSSFTLLPILPVIVAAFQMGYGLGFLRGLLDFVILRRGPDARFTMLTRPPEPGHGADGRQGLH